MLNKFSFKVKIAGCLFILMAGLVVVSSILIFQYHQEWTQAKGLLKGIHVIAQNSAAIHELQKERAKSVLYLGKKIPKEELETQRQLVNEKINLARDHIHAYDSESIQQKLLAAESLLKQIRSDVDSGEKKAKEIAGAIGRLVDQWIGIQVESANQYHYQGFETGLISTAIFEKSKENMGRLRASLNVVLSENQAIKPQVVSNLSVFITGILSNIDSPGLAISNESRQQIDRILNSADWKQVLTVYDKVLEKSLTGEYEQDAKEFSATITRVIDALKEVVVTEINNNTQKISLAENEIKFKFYMGLSAVILLIVLSSLFSTFVLNSVSKTLLEVALGITNGAETVFAISAEVAHAGQELSANSTQQASALQETSTAVEQTSTMIAKNTENAKRSAEVSKKGQTTAEYGKSTVHEMVGSIEDISNSNEEIMKQIEKSNKEMAEIIQVIVSIGDKTKVINDIVFQTKLLSFNASVEAARVGESGKGFAVVAEEVGNLAQMSGNSAKEITDLIAQSIEKVERIVKSMVSGVNHLIVNAKDKVENGKKMAGRYTEVFDEVATDVSQVNLLVADISLASEEQARGVAEINKAIKELDSSAEQNNLATQKATHSAEELKVQVTHLQEMVSNLNEVIYGKSL